MNQTKPTISLSTTESLMPQEEMLEIPHQQASLTIGIPKEISNNESRIGLVPEAVKLLVENGHRILIETLAGKKARYSDREFAEAGAEICSTRDQVFKADIVLKIAPPIREEIELLGNRKCLFSVLQLPARTKDYFQQLTNKKIKAIAFEFLQDKTGALPLVKGMSEIIGNACMMIASEYLCHPQYGKGSMLGGFPGVAPTEVVIIGAGTVAEYASRAALGMGALVKVFDNSMYKLRSLQAKSGMRLYTSTLHPLIIEQALKTADVVIAAKYSSTGISPCLITESAITNMKEGTVIIDVSIDQGGCFETSRPTTHQNPVYQIQGVTHYCVPNIASRVPRTASTSFSNFFAPLLLEIAAHGGVDNLLKHDRGLAKGTYIFNGTITNQQISQLYDLPFQPLDLLLAAYL
ncbi:MAG: alanine dehydrogenase [Bacteroidales bacterium]|jgi:alanine dehydrogenase|nr:alanine dehydrogenase [Bacteroidales bacterium]MDD3700963.1 alanine dehydrogenase [Bacteroidales bacterium]MDY0370223.1 alanine dehydrogenase [Bacteroidales bacterium]